MPWKNNCTVGCCPLVQQLANFLLVMVEMTKIAIFHVLGLSSDTPDDACEVQLEDTNVLARVARAVWKSWRAS
jgi:hypothetical protein